MKLTKEQITFKENTIKSWKNDIIQLEMNLEVFELAREHTKRKLELGFHLNEADNQINETKNQLDTLKRNLKAVQIQLEEKDNGKN